MRMPTWSGTFAGPWCGEHQVVLGRDGRRLHGLLTATAVTHWLASSWEPGVAADTTVADVLEVAHDHSDGKPTQKPIGILTAADLLALIEMF